MAANPEKLTCYFCKKICLTDAVFCELCNTWLHFKCLKFSKKQYNNLSSSNDPFFCTKCISSALPFVNIPKTHLDLFNSTISEPKLSLPCYKCHKHIHNHQQSIKCNLGKHILHFKCSNLNRSDQDNNKLWSCQDCLKFPFSDLDNEQILIETSFTVKTKRNAKITLNKTLNNFNKHLPQLILPDMTDNDNDSPMNFSYYDNHHLLELSKKINPDDTLSFFHTNIRSYNDKIDEFKALLNTFPLSFDIIGMSETWDTEEHPIEQQAFEGYQEIERQKGSSQNSGVAVYIKNGLPYIRRHDLSSAGKNDFEYLFIEIENNNNKNEQILVGTFYRHPNSKISNFINEIKNIFLKIKNEKKKNCHNGRL